MLYIVYTLSVIVDNEESYGRYHEDFRYFRPIFGNFVCQVMERIGHYRFTFDVTKISRNAALLARCQRTGADCA